MDRRGWYNVWIEQVEPSVRRHLSGFGLPHDELEDLVSEGREVAVGQAQRRDVREAAGFLHVVAVNYARKVLGGRDRTRVRRFEPGEEEALTCAHPDPAEIVAEAELLASVREARSSLPRNEAGALHLTLDCGMTAAEAGRALRIPERTMRARVARGLKHVRGRLADRGLMP